MTAASSYGCTNVRPSASRRLASAVASPRSARGARPRAEDLGALHLHERGVGRHHDRGLDAEAGRVAGDGLGVVARRHRDDARSGARPRSAKQLVQRAALLERRGELEVLELHDDAGAEHLRQRVRPGARRCARRRRRSAPRPPRTSSRVTVSGLTAPRLPRPPRPEPALRVGHGAGPGTRGHRDGAVDGRPRVGQVRVEAAAGVEVGRERHAGSAATARLAARPIPVSNIPPTHSGTPSSTQRSCTARGRDPPADPRRLEAHDLAGTERDRRFDGRQRREGLVEADRRVQALGQAGVAEQIVGRERLLEAGQADARRAASSSASSSGTSRWRRPGGARRGRRASRRAASGPAARARARSSRGAGPRRRRARRPPRPAGRRRRRAAPRAAPAGTAVAVAPSQPPSERPAARSCASSTASSTAARAVGWPRIRVEVRCRGRRRRPAGPAGPGAAGGRAARATPPSVNSAEYVGCGLDRALGPPVGLAGPNVHQQHVARERSPRAVRSGVARCIGTRTSSIRSTRDRRQRLERRHRSMVAPIAFVAVTDVSTRHGVLKANDPCWCGSGKKFKRCHKAASANVRPGRSAPPGPCRPRSRGRPTRSPAAPVRRRRGPGAAPRRDRADARGRPGRRRGARRSPAPRSGPGSPPTSSTPSATRPASTAAATPARSTTTASPSRSARR